MPVQSGQKPESGLPILVVDDDEGQRSLLQSFLTRQGFEIIAASSGNEALDILGAQPIAMMISDVRMPGLSGLEALRHARAKRPNLPVLLVTAYAHIRDAVNAMRDGAINYLEKPIDLDELLALVRDSVGIHGPAPGYVADDLKLPANVIAQSPRTREVFREVALVAPSETRVLLTGESGVGKEVVADMIHAWSSRAARLLIKVNCAAIPDTLLESELFGHEKGAFTGATSQRIGRFEEADRGAILLDEVSEMSPALQAKLLRVTQDGGFHRVGSNQERKTNVRILAATNRNLEQEVEQGRFREDLFYRLNVVEIYVPPLRDRPEDILPLAQLFAGQFSEGNPRFSASAAAALQFYDWPGNIRELKNAMERAALMARGNVILPEHLPQRIQEAVRPPAEASSAAAEGSRLEEIERATILQTLREHNFNRTETARVLGISRRALIYKLRRFREQGLDVGIN
ncbi:sigma-54-dependent Fis family transcriptional regulator [Candidatus Sumerlaeota bacterium]|nr:sigma-54-dependent Fis family transcriptional regulator [Candidatus Sumerlaeota bacterium]